MMTRQKVKQLHDILPITIGKLHDYVMRSRDMPIYGIRKNNSNKM